MADCFILLNSGDKILLNDGVSALLKNSCDEVVDLGVTIEGTHARPDLTRTVGFTDPGTRKKKRVLVYTLEAHAKLSVKHTLLSESRLQRLTQYTAKSRITQITEGTAISKITRLHNKIAESLVYYTDPESAKKYKTEYEIKTEREARTKQLMNKDKKGKIRKLYEEYKDEFG